MCPVGTHLLTHEFIAQLHTAACNLPARARQWGSRQTRLGGWVREEKPPRSGGGAAAPGTHVMRFLKSAPSQLSGDDSAHHPPPFSLLPRSPRRVRAALSWDFGD